MSCLPALLNAQVVVTHGRVIHAVTGAPLANVTVTAVPAVVVGASTSVVTDSLGRFAAALAEGSYWFRWRGIGLTPDSVLRVVPWPDVLELPATSLAINLDAVRVEARSGVFETELLRNGFRDREKLGFGIFFDRVELARRPPTSLVMLLRPWLRGCTLIFVDGSRLQGLRDVPIEIVAGIEVYRRNSETPIAYLNPFDCGSIVVWTTTPGG